MIRKLVLGALALFSATDSLEAQRQDRVIQGARLVADTLVSTDAAILEKPSDMVLLPGGKVAILDYGPSEIVVVNARDGSLLTTIGRRGRGPGELFYPLGLASRADTIMTANVGNGRIERFPSTQNRSVRLPEGSRTGRIAVNGDGGFLLPTAGQHRAIVRLYSREGELVSALGSPVVKPDFEWRLADYRLQARQGLVPDYFRNQVVVAMAADSSVWVGFQTEGRIERYSSAGQLLTTVHLPEALLVRFKSEYRRRNLEEPTGTRVIPLEFFSDIKVSDGTAWILLNSPKNSPREVMSIDSRGRVTMHEVLGLPAVWRILYDPSRGVLYFSSSSEAAVYSATVPRQPTRN